MLRPKRSPPDGLLLFWSKLPVIPDPLGDTTVHDVVDAAALCLRRVAGPPGDAAGLAGGGAGLGSTFGMLGADGVVCLLRWLFDKLIFAATPGVAWPSPALPLLNDAKVTAAAAARKDIFGFL